MCTTTSAVATSLRQRARPVVRLEVEDDRPLAAVERDEVAADPGCDGHHLPVGVAARRLDLDHLGAELGEERARERAGHVLRVPRRRALLRAAGSSQAQPAPRDHELLHLGRAAGDRRADRRAVERGGATLDRRLGRGVAEALEAEQVDRRRRATRCARRAPASFAIADVALPGQAPVEQCRRRGTRAAGRPASSPRSRASRSQAARRAGRSRAAAPRPRRAPRRAPPIFSAVTRSKSSVCMSTSQPPFDLADEVRGRDLDAVEEHLAQVAAAERRERRTSIPGVSTGATSTEMPRCFGSSGSVRTAR